MSATMEFMIMYVGCLGMCAQNESTTIAEDVFDLEETITFRSESTRPSVTVSSEVHQARYITKTGLTKPLEEPNVYYYLIAVVASVGLALLIFILCIMCYEPYRQGGSQVSIEDESVQANLKGSPCSDLLYGDAVEDQRFCKEIHKTAYDARDGTRRTLFGIENLQKNGAGATCPLNPSPCSMNKNFRNTVIPEPSRSFPSVPPPYGYEREQEIERYRGRENEEWKEAPKFTPSNVNQIFQNGHPKNNYPLPNNNPPTCNCSQQYTNPPSPNHYSEAYQAYNNHKTDYSPTTFNSQTPKYVPIIFPRGAPEYNPKHIPIRLQREPTSAAQSRARREPSYVTQHHPNRKAYQGQQCFPLRETCYTPKCFQRQTPRNGPQIYSKRLPNNHPRFNPNMEYSSIDKHRKYSQDQNFGYSKENKAFRNRHRNSEDDTSSGGIHSFNSVDKRKFVTQKNIKKHSKNRIVEKRFP